MLELYVEAEVNVSFNIRPDRNAAFNIAYRALGYISKVGVTVNMPNLKLRTFASVDRNAMMTREAIHFNRW
jgi:hypothetical protein